MSMDKVLDTMKLEKKAETSEEMKIPKVLIAVPSRGVGVSINFAYDFANLVAHTTAALVAHQLAVLRLIIGSHTYIDQNRNDLCAAALVSDATHVLWLDDDMRFPKDALLRLMERGVDVVGANYPSRRVENGIAPVTIKHIGGEGAENPAERCYTRPDSTGIEEVDAVGFGCLLMRTSAIAAIPHPWFEQFFDHDNERWVGEDVDFCMKLKAEGIRAYIDHDLSKEVSHTGTFEFNMQHALAYEAHQQEEQQDGSDDIHGTEGVDSGLAEQG